MRPTRPPGTLAHPVRGRRRRARPSYRPPQVAARPDGWHRHAREGIIEDTTADYRPDLVDVLRDLAALRDGGLLTEAQFQRARAHAVARWSRAETVEHPAR